MFRRAGSFAREGDEMGLGGRAMPTPPRARQSRGRATPDKSNVSVALRIPSKRETAKNRGRCALGKKCKDRVLPRVEVMNDQQQLAKAGLTEILGQQLHVAAAQFSVPRLLQRRGTANHHSSDANDSIVRADVSGLPIRSHSTPRRVRRRLRPRADCAKKLMTSAAVPTNAPEQYQTWNDGRQSLRFKPLRQS